jgi:hypothetical protein
MDNSFKKHELGSNIKVILDVKEEYINKFINITRERFKEGYQSIYDNVKESNTISKLVLKEFQDKLKLVPLWSEKMIEDEFNRIKIVSKCDYLEQLIEALFSSYSQMFMLVNKKNEEAIKIPSQHYVIHNCYIEIARSLWKKPQLYYHRYDTKTRQTLNAELDGLIQDNIILAIKKLIPFKELLNNYLEKTDTSLDELNDLSISNQDEDEDEEGDITHDYEVVNKEMINNNDDNDYDDNDYDDDNNDEVVNKEMINNNDDNDYDDNDYDDDNNDDEIVEEFEINEDDDDDDEDEDENEDDEEVDEQVAEEVTEEVTEEVDEEVTEEVTEQVAEEVTEEVDEEVTEEVTEQVAEEVAEEVDEQVAEEVDEEEQIKKVEDINENFKEPADNTNDYYKIDKSEVENIQDTENTQDIKEINISNKKNTITNKKKKINNEKKIERYLGVNIGVNDFKKNKEDIKRMLLHKSITNV